MRPFRICMFARTLPAHRGGSGMFHPMLAGRALAARGHQVEILSTAHPRGERTEHPCPGLTLHYLAGTPSDRYSDDYWRESSEAFRAMHRALPFDAAWSDSASAYGFAKLLRPAERPPLAVVCHAGAPAIVGEEAAAFYRAHMHPLFDAADRVVCVSSTVLRWVLAGHPAAAPKCRIVTNGADLSGFRAASHASRPADAPVRIVSVGRVVPEKGLDVLLRAAAMVRGARPEVHIVGPGAHGDVLCALAGELRIPMRWTPGVPHGRVPEVLANADIAALPSRHNEGLPFALIEACAASLPIVAFDIGGVREVVRDGFNGFLVPPGDTARFADRLERLSNDAWLRRSMGNAGRRLAESRFGLEAMASNFESLLWSMMHERSERPGAERGLVAA